MSELKTNNSKRVDVTYDNNAENTEWFDTKDMNLGSEKEGDLPAQNIAVMEPDDLIMSREEQLEQFLMENDIVSAVTRDGETLTDQAAIINALMEEGSSLQLYTEGRKSVSMMRNKNGAIEATPLTDQTDTVPLSLYRDRLPQKKMSLGFNDDDLLYAIDEDGSRIEGSEAILDRLQNGEGRLFVYTSLDRENPYVIDHQDDDYLVSKWPIPENQRDDIPEDAFKKVENPAFSEDYLLKWKEEDIDFAVDENGRRYEGAEQVATALYGADKKLQLFLKDKDIPVSVEKKRNRFYGPDDEMLEASAQEDDFFEPVAKDQTDEFFRRNWQIGEITNSALQKAKSVGLDFTKPELDFVLDENGKLYRDIEKIKELARIKGKKLFVFDKSGEPPYAIENREGMLYKSSERISSLNKLEDTPAFDPRKSLKVGDIIKVADRRELNLLKDKWDDVGKTLKFYNDNIERIKKIKSGPEPKEPVKPKKPGMGFFGGLWYGVKLVITFGMGDTDRHKYLPMKRKDYQEKMKLYPSLVDKYKRDKREYDDVKEHGDQKLEEYQKGLKATSDKLRTLRGQKEDAEKRYMANLHENSEMHVNRYRENLEVRLEGVSDLLKKGKITPENLFAHAWLKKAECEGMPASSPAARKALCAFIAADTLDAELLINRVNFVEINEPLEERRLAPLNSGEAAKKLMEDPELQKLLNEMGDRPIDAEEIKEAYLTRVSEREKEEHQAIPYLKKQKELMNIKYGSHQLDEEMFDEVLRYKRFDTDIKIQQDNRKATTQEEVEGRYKAAVQATKDTFAYKISDEKKQEFREAYNLVKAQGKKEMTLEELSKALDEKKAELQN